MFLFAARPFFSNHEYEILRYWDPYYVTVCAVLMQQLSWWAVRPVGLIETGPS